MSEWLRQRESERMRERNGQTQRQDDIGCEREWQTDRQTDRLYESERECGCEGTDTQTEKETYRERVSDNFFKSHQRERDRQTDGEGDSVRERQSEWERNRKGEWVTVEISRSRKQLF